MRTIVGGLMWCLSLMWVTVQGGEELFTNVYAVPPTFLNSGNIPGEKAGSRVSHPRAKEVLKSAGISFPRGASAIYNPEKSQLVVRNTEEQMELVEAYVESVKTGFEKQIYLTFWEVVIPEGGREGFGFDWLIELPEADQVPKEGKSFESLEAFKEELSRPPSNLKPRERDDSGIAGVFTDPQFQLLIRALNQEKGVELLDAPSVMTYSGKPAISQREERRYGVIPVIGADGYTIDLKIFLPEHGEALFEKGDPLETPIKLTIWDGQAVAVERKDKEGKSRTVFVKAQIMDPAGTPMNTDTSSKGGAVVPESNLPESGLPESEIDRLVEAATTDLMRSARAPSENASTTGMVEVTYTVPPNFLFLDGGSTLFLNGRDTLTRIPQEILEGAGIIFPDGASAIFSASESSLEVVTTPDQHELVEAFIESMRGGVEKQIYLSVQNLTLDERAVANAKKLGLDWMVDLPEKPISTTARKPGTIHSKVDLLRELSFPPANAGQPNETELFCWVANTLTPTDYQATIRALDDMPTVDLISLPSQMQRSGQSGMIQVGTVRIGVEPLLGADEGTIDLLVYLPELGKAHFLMAGEIDTPYRLTVKDGHTAALGQYRPGEERRIVFVSAEIMDAAGNPIRKKTATGIPPKRDRTVKTEIDPDKVKEADELALRGSQLLADGAYREAISKFEQALAMLPQHEMVLPRQNAYRKQISNAHAELGKQYREGAFHIVKEGETLASIAKKAELPVSRIQSANRLEGTNIEVGQVLSLSRDKKSTRKESFSLNDLILSKVDFADLTLPEALGFIQKALLSHEKVDLLFPDEGPKIILREAEKFENIRITLRLDNVPVKEALRYIASLARCGYEIEGSQIIVFPK